MEDYHIGNGKGVPLKIFRVVDVETSVNIFQCFTGQKFRCINHLVIVPVYREPFLFQPIKGHKAQVIGAVR